MNNDITFYLRKSRDRGFVDLGWLKSYHTFSFGNYYDSRYTHFGNLRVINQDLVTEGMGFEPHGHKDMEIISYIIDGELEHKDSMGNGSVIHKGDVQRISAGTGIEHSEFNPSNNSKSHFLQIWVLPKIKNIIPSYEQQHFSNEQKYNRLKLIVANDREYDAIQINQDAKIYASILDNKVITHLVPAKTKIWIQVISGKLSVRQKNIETGDGLGIMANDNVYELIIKNVATTESEFLLFELLV